MKKLLKNDLRDNLLASLFGVVFYIVIYCLLPKIELNSVIDILLFIVCYFIGSTIYMIIKKNKNNENDK